MAEPAGLLLVHGRPQDRVAVDRLLLDIFGVDMSPLAAHGLLDRSYTPFCYVDDAGALVANAAVFSLTLMVGGQLVDAIGLQTVATRPAWRGRGVMRALLAHVLDWCDRQHRPVLLMTDIPAFYAPLGFSLVPQRMFVGEAPAPSWTRHVARRLNMTNPADQAIVAARLRGRVAVSAQFAVVGGAGSFLLALDQPHLCGWWSAELAALVVTSTRPDGTLCLVDVAANAMPDLATILGALGVAPARVEVHVPPDRLGWTGTPVPAEGLTLMVRGTLPGAKWAMLPETAWF